MNKTLTSTLHRAVVLVASAAAVLAVAAPARADLATDLAGLEVKAAALKDAASGVDSATNVVCGPIASVNDMSKDLVSEVTRIDDSLAAPLTVDQASLDAIGRLSLATADLASEAARMSTDLQAQQAVLDSADLNDGIAAVLRLSDDIGTMADRIGEMSDKILVMSDNIGTMADRILVTQQIQSQNLQVTEATLLQTQANALSLVSVIEQSTYDLTLTDLINRGNLLAAQMAATVLNPWTMASTLSKLATSVQDLRNQVDALRDTVVASSASSTFSTVDTSLSQLVSATVMTASLQTAVDGYVIAISGLQAITSTTTLTASLKSMLQLSADIGLMANRILEMADQILAMADNIGVQADQINLTQQAASANVASTQAQILSVQEFAVTLIALRTN